MPKVYDSKSPLLASTLGLKPPVLPFSVYEGRNIEPDGHIAARVTQIQTLTAIAEAFVDIMPTISTSILDKTADLTSQFSTRNDREMDNLVHRYQSGRGPVRKAAEMLQWQVVGLFSDAGEDAANASRQAVNNALKAIADLLNAKSYIQLNHRSAGGESALVTKRAWVGGNFPAVHSSIAGFIKEQRRIRVLHSTAKIAERDKDRYEFDPLSNRQLEFGKKGDVPYMRIPLVVTTNRGHWILPIHVTFIKSGTSYAFGHVSCGIVYDEKDPRPACSVNYLHDHLLYRPLQYDLVEQASFPGHYSTMAASLIDDRVGLLLADLEYTLQQAEKGDVHV